MFNCDEVIQLLTDYVDGELEGEAQLQLETHFRKCPSCDHFLATFKKTIDLTGEFRCEEIPEYVQKRLHDFLEDRIRDLDQENPA